MVGWLLLLAGLVWCVLMPQYKLVASQSSLHYKIAMKVCLLAAEQRIVQVPDEARTVRAAAVLSLNVKCMSWPGSSCVVVFSMLQILSGPRPLSRAALQSGRSALALTPDPAELDQLAAVLRPACRQLESQYRDTDGLVLELAPAL